MTVFLSFPPTGKPKISQNEFGDLLGGFSAAQKEDGPKKIKDIRKAQMVEEMDPDKLKVADLIQHSLY